ACEYLVAILTSSNARPCLESGLTGRETGHVLEGHGGSLVPGPAGRLGIHVSPRLLGRIVLEDPRKAAGRATHLQLHLLRRRGEADRVLVPALPGREEREVGEGDPDAGRVVDRPEQAQGLDRRGTGLAGLSQPAVGEAEPDQVERELQLISGPPQDRDALLEAFGQLLPASRLAVPDHEGCG